MGEAPDRRSIGLRLLDLYTEDEVIEWLTSPHPQLDGKAPVLLAGTESCEEVHEVIDRLVAGTYL